MSRETMDVEGSGQPPGPGGQAGPALDLDLALDDPSPAPTPPPAPAPRAAPERDPAAGPGEDGDLDGFAADLGEDRTDRTAAARMPGEPLTALDRRRIRLAAVAAGAVALLVLAAVGGYSEGQKAQARDALTTARVIGQMDPSELSLQRSADGQLIEPVVITLHLSISASVTARVTQLVLPVGEVRLGTRVVLGPGAGVDARFELRNLCRPGSPGSSTRRPTTATLRTADGTEVSVPLLLGFERDLLSSDGLCATAGPPPQDLPVTVERMTAQLDGTVRVTLDSQADQEMTVEPVQSAASNSGPFSWKVGLVPRGGTVRVPARGTVTMVIRLTTPTCFPDRSVSPANGLIAFRVTGTAPGSPTTEVDAGQLRNWDDQVVAGASAVTMALQCR